MRLGHDAEVEADLWPLITLQEDLEDSLMVLCWQLHQSSNEEGEN